MIFSIIIPVYNNPKGIKTLLESLIEQDFQKELYEIIVVDDCSKDGTVDVAAKFSKQYPYLIRCLSENKNKGSYAARNKGICCSRGEVLAFIDSDCIASADWLSSGLAYITCGASCVGGNILFTYMDKNKPNIFEYLDSAMHLRQEAYIDYSHFSTTANFFVKKRIFEKYGCFEPGLISGGDVEFGTRLYSHGEKIRYAPNVIVYHPARPNFNSLLKKIKRTSLGMKHLIERQKIKEKPFMLKQLVPRLWFPRNTKISCRLSLADRVMLITFCNIFNWIRLYYRHFSQSASKFCTQAVR